MQTVENVTIYKCDFCNKELKRKHAMEKHEENCLKNPVNSRLCLSCPLLIKKEATVYYDDWNGESERKVDLFYCEAKQHFLYTPKNETKKNWFDLGYELNEPMPKECDIEIDEYLNF